MGPGKIVQDNKSLSYPVFELTGVQCKKMLPYKFHILNPKNSWVMYPLSCKMFVYKHTETTECVKY